MEKISLPGTDLKVSRVCLGTMTFGGQVEEATAASLTDYALEQGINFFDTANVYVKGVSEEFTGRILKGRRDKVVLATKVGQPMGTGPLDVGLTRAAIMHHVENSLKRLQTDYIDLYYFHAPDHKTPIDESLAAMTDLVKQGKVRALAVSNYASWQVVQMRWLAEVRKLVPVVATQPMYNLLARRLDAEFLPMAKKVDVATIAYNPLAGGMLTGKHSANQGPTSGTRFDKNEQYQSRYWNDENFHAIELLNAAAAKEGRSLISLALNWLLKHSAINCVILGASKLDHLRSNLAVLKEGPLTEESLAVCEEVARLQLGFAPNYIR